jgi:hypothetical protein
MKKANCSLTLLLVVAGCAPQMAPVSPRGIIHTSYEIGATSRSKTGDPVITVESAYSTPVYVAAFEYTPPKAEPIVAGTLFRVVGTFPDSEQLVLKNDNYNKVFDIVADRSGMPLGWYPRRRKAPKDFGKLDRPLFKESTDIRTQPNGFAGELIYSGLAGQTIKMIYREYKGDVARPAFAQELQYDLSQSREVAFRSIRLEVLNATNSEIEFRVLSDGGLPWVPYRK